MSRGGLLNPEKAAAAHTRAYRESVYSQLQALAKAEPELAEKCAEIEAGLRERWVAMPVERK